MDAAPEGALELLDGIADHRVHHLLVEARIRLGGRNAVRNEDKAVVEIDRAIVLLARDIVVDHDDLVERATGIRWAGCQRPVAHVHLHFVAE